MRGSRAMLFASLSAVLVPVSAARAETKVGLKGVHLCCPACPAAVQSTLRHFDGVEATCDQKKKTVTISAPDDNAVQKALDALAAHGFRGDTGNGTLKFKDDSGTATDKVASVKLVGIHKCCGSCN